MADQGTQGNASIALGNTIKAHEAERLTKDYLRQQGKVDKPYPPPPSPKCESAIRNEQLEAKTDNFFRNCIMGKTRKRGK